MPRTAKTLALAALLALGAALLFTERAEAGACARFHALALELVDPGGPIVLGPGAGPLVLHTVSGESYSRAERAQQDHPLDRLRVRGPGAPRVTPRQVAPGVHRLEAAYRAGAHRVTGTEPGGAVTFVAGPEPAIEAPALAAARLLREERRQSITRGGGTTTVRVLEVALSRPAPRGAWRVLLYPAPTDASRSALHSVPTTAGATSARFVEGSSSMRCGPTIPGGGVTNPGTEVAVAWLRADGRVSPLSNRVPTVEP